MNPRKRTHAGHKNNANKGMIDMAFISNADML